MAEQEKKVAEYDFPASGGGHYTVVVRSDMTYGCECDNFAAGGKCTHGVTGLAQATKEGKFEGVSVGMPAKASPPARQAPAPANGSTFPARRESVPSLDEFRKLGSGDFFPTGGGKTAASARAWNVWALGPEGVSSELVRDKDGKPCSGIDATHAWAVVRGKREGLIREASVTIVFSLEWDALIWDLIDRREKKNERCAYEMDAESGRPVLTEKKDQLHIIRQFNRIRRFAERIAVTKAEAIVQRKLLGADWREDEEKEHEEREVKAVDEMRTEPPPGAAPISDPARRTASKFPAGAA